MYRSHEAGLPSPEARRGEARLQRAHIHRGSEASLHKWTRWYLCRAIAARSAARAETKHREQTVNFSWDRRASAWYSGGGPYGLTSVVPSQRIEESDDGGDLLIS